MASCDDYAVAWICALPVEVAAARAALDSIHTNVLPGRDPDDNNEYIVGSIQGHNVVVAYPKSGLRGKTSMGDVARQLHARYTSIRFNLVVGIAGGVPDTKEDIRLGDVVVSKSTAGCPGIVQFDVNGKQTQPQYTQDRASDQPTPLLLTAVGKAETAAIFDESKMSQYMSEIVQKDPVIFAHPGPEQDVLFEPDYEHATTESEEGGCNHCRAKKVRYRQPRDVQDPLIHYGLVAFSGHLTRQGAIQDRVANKRDILCIDKDTAGLRNAGRYLVIRGICDYADAHRSELWHAYAAAAAAAYAKEVLSFIPTVFRATPLTANSYSEAAPVLDALLLTRPEVDRKSLIALKGRRVDGTCEWLAQHPKYENWLADENQPLLWISGGPGKGKTMLAIYITEMLQPVVQAADNVLLYYFCSGRDKNRNTAVAVMRGILHQWLDFHPHLAKEVKSSFEGTETTKYTISNFVSLWRVFLALLQQSTSSQIVCVLDGLDECERESLRQLLDAIGNHLSKTGEKAMPCLKLIILSRPEPAVLENKLGHYQQIQLDAADTEISHDVERYIFAKVAELASEQDLSEDMVAQVQQTLLDGADGTFLWVGFVANELQGRSWTKIDEVLRNIPKGLGGIYQRLLQQIPDKEILKPILQWVVLAARPLTLEELTVAARIHPTGIHSATQVTRNRLKAGGLLVKIEGDVVNLIHESAKEFFHSEQIHTKGIDMFAVSQDTYWVLLQTCLAHLLINKHAHLISRRDNYGRTPLSWAVNQGHQEMVQLLLDYGARVNFKDRSRLTALHIAVTGQHKDVVSVLLEHGAHLEAKAEYGDTDTPLMRAILANSREITQELLEHGARVDKVPTVLGVPPLKVSSDPVDERVTELLGLQEQVLLARFKRSSRFVAMVMNGLGLSLRLPFFLEFMSFYLKFVVSNRWDTLSVLQELVNENKTDELREWAKLYHVFFLGLVEARNPKRLKAMGDLSTQILQKVGPRDLQALLAITVFTGMDTKLTAIQHRWREGDAITAAAVADWAAIACDRDELEYFHFGIREFLSDFDGCIRSGDREENVLRTTLLITGYFAMVEKQHPGPIEYFSRVVAEFFEGYIGTSYELELSSDANRACANELLIISRSRDSARLRLLLTSILHFAQQANERGQDRFLNVPPAACLIICQENATPDQWLIGEAVPEEIAALIARETPGLPQKQVCRTFVECLIIGKQ
ncbi:uncharacterized protein MYCFIDRAFT_104649, partial [Pseudocercospora fijiensis CIRAD86]